MNFNALPGKVVNELSSGFNMVDNFFNNQSTNKFDQASKLNSWQPTPIVNDAKHGIPNFKSYRASVAEDRARLLPLTDPITVGFKMMVDWQKDYGLICDEDITKAQSMTTKNNSAVAYLYRIGEDNRAIVLQKWIKQFKQLIVLYDFLFLHIEGLDLVQNKKPGHIFTEDDKINIVFRETVDLRIQSLINTYNWIWYDNIRGVEVLPSNLRKFDAYIMVFDVNYYSALLYDLDASGLGAAYDTEDKKYDPKSYYTPIADVEGKLERGEMSQKEYDKYYKQMDKAEDKANKLVEQEEAKFAQLTKDINDGESVRKVVPTKAKVAALMSYDVKDLEILNLANNTNYNTSFNHMIYEFKSMSFDVTETGKGFTGNVSNEPNSEFVRNNITFNFKRAFATGEFYNSFAFPTGDGNINPNPADLIAMGTIQSALEREVTIIEAQNDELDLSKEIGLEETVVKPVDAPDPKKKFKIKINWKKTSHLLKIIAIEAGRKIGKEIWNKQKAKILSQNSVIGNLINVFKTQSLGSLGVKLIEDNIGIKIQNVVNKNINLITDVLPTKDDIILSKIGSDNNGSLSNGAKLLTNPNNIDPNTGEPFSSDTKTNINNDVKLTSENIYSGSTKPENPEFKTGLNVYDGSGF